MTDPVPEPSPTRQEEDTAPSRKRSKRPLTAAAWEDRAAKFALTLMKRMRHLPQGFVGALGRALGTFAYSLWGRYRRVALDNLRQAFPEKSEGEIERIARETFINWGVFVLQSLRLPYFRERDWQERIVIEGREHVENALARGNGAIILSGHFGCIELGPATIAHEGAPVSVVVRYAKNQEITDQMNAIREAAGYRVLSHDARGFRAMQRLRNNEIVCILIDQDAGTRGVFVEYFGRLCSAPPGPALLAARTGAALIPAFVVLEKDGRYRMIAEPELPHPGPDPPPEALQEVLQAATSRLEEMVRRYPNHWLWMHRRWKTKPPEETATATG